MVSREQYKLCEAEKEKYRKYRKERRQSTIVIDPRQGDNTNVLHDKEQYLEHLHRKGTQTQNKKQKIRKERDRS